MSKNERTLVPTTLRVLAAAAVAVMAIAILAQCFAAGGIFRTREQARRTKCLNNLKQLGLALRQYSQDFRDIYPWCVGASEPKAGWLDLGLLYPSYNSAFQVFICPSAKDREFDPKCESGDKKDHPFEPLKPADTKEVISYAYGFDNTDSSHRTSWTETASSTVRLAADKKAGCGLSDESNHKKDGRNVLYNDGHVKWQPGPKALNPDEEDDDVGDPDDLNYVDWWSDPPFYAEGMEEEKGESSSE